MLSDEDRARLRAMAEDEGFDPDEIEAAADEMDADAEPEPRAKESPEAKPVTATDPPKVFQYHLPFMRVNEVRRTIGLPEDAPDGDLMTGDWIAKYGGGTSTPPAPESV